MRDGDHLTYEHGYVSNRDQLIEAMVIDVYSRWSTKGALLRKLLGGLPDDWKQMTPTQRSEWTLKQLQERF